MLAALLRDHRVVDLLDQGSFVLRECAEHMKQQLARRRGGVHRMAVGLQIGAQHAVPAHVHEGVLRRRISIEGTTRRAIVNRYGFDALKRLIKIGGLDRPPCHGQNSTIRKATV